MPPATSIYIEVPIRVSVTYGDDGLIDFSYTLRLSTIRNAARNFNLCG